MHGVLVNMLVEIAPNIYKDYIVFENGKKVLYLLALKAIYGLLKNTLLFYKNCKTI